ncbi:MAG: hypothetical protein CR997_03840 [Acidobacteria bacterium]|nr:MAG: hypothetical protein CR997_03840 [Acidobacteriota bacterium]
MFLLLTFSLSFYGSIELAKERDISFIDYPVQCLVVNNDGDCYLIGYWHSKVTKVSAEGKFLYQIQGRFGQGPGEFGKPTNALIMNHGQTLLIIDSHGKMVLFNEKTGEFIKTVSKRDPANLFLKYDETHFLLMFNINPSDHLFKILNLDGEMVHSWFPQKIYDDLYKKDVWTRRYAACLGPDKELYFQEGSYPEILLFEKDKDFFKTIKLKWPKYYREPPEKAFNPKHRFNKKKIQEYFNSYTQLKNFFYISDKYILIVWYIYKPYEISMDLYNIKDNQLLIKDFVPKGEIVTVHSNSIYVLEEVEDDELDSDSDLILRTYLLKEK